MSVLLKYEDLWKFARPHVDLAANFAALRIDSPRALTDAKIKEVAQVALEAAHYAHLGFGMYTPGRDEMVRKLFEGLRRLDEEGTVFTVYADAYEGDKNIESKATLLSMREFQARWGSLG